MTAPSQSPAAVERLRAELARCSAHGWRMAVAHGDVPALLFEHDRLAAEVARLRKALRFYADPAVYKAHPHGPAFDGRDLSFVARAALEQKSGCEGAT